MEITKKKETYQTPRLNASVLNAGRFSKPLCGSCTIPDLTEEEGGFDWQ